MTNEMRNVVVVGLGYVGIPLIHAILSSNSDTSIYGVDNSIARVASLNNSNLPVSLSKLISDPISI